MGKFYFIVIMIVLLIIGVIAYFISDRNSFFSNGATIIGWLLFIIQLVYNMVPLVKLFIKRNLVFILNPTVNWGMDIVLKVKDVDSFRFEELLNKVEKYLMEYDDFKIVKQNKSRAFYTVNGENIIITFRDDQILTIEFGERNISYRESLKIIKGYSKHIEKLNLSVRSTEQEYFVSLKFKDKKTPFTGVLINDLDDINIESYRVKYNQTSGSVDIHNNKVELYSNSLSDILELSKKYLHVSKRL